MSTFVKAAVYGQVMWFRQDRVEEDGEWVDVYVDCDGKQWGVSNILQSVEANKFEDLDWHGTIIDATDGDPGTGWLSPDGVFYPCRYENHEDYARFILKQDRGDLDREGWVTVGHSPLSRFTWKNAWSFSYGELKVGKPLTLYQKEWLGSHGHVIEEDD